KNGLDGSSLTAVIRPHVAPTLDGSRWFDDIILLDHRSSRRQYRTLAVLGQLRRECFNLAVLLPNSYRSALVARLAGIPRRIGYQRHGRGLLLTDVLHHPVDADGHRLPTPIVETYLKLARRLGCPVESTRLELATTPADEAAADQAWAELGLAGPDPVVCLNTGGAFGPAKNWPVEHFAALARRLAEESGARVLVVCGPSERENARAIVVAAGHDRVVSLADRELSIGLTKASIRRATLLITTDSGPRHFAAAFGTPVISLFGPTHIAWTRTHHPLAWHVRHPVPCGPCQRPVCPKGHHLCMKDLLPEGVFAVARRVLATSANYS
ncbi:MAG: lipopolysaccharide heptosyltransferase II, partial [Isosphaeraceae bacterium]